MQTGRAVLCIFEAPSSALSEGFVRGCLGFLQGGTIVCKRDSVRCYRVNRLGRSTPHPTELQLLCDAERCPVF